MALEGPNNIVPQQQQTTKKKRNMWMFDFIFSAVEKVFPVAEGEPVTNRVPRLNSRENILEEEVLFCKNNVCVHEPANGSSDGSFGEEKRVPGYLSMKKIYRADSHISDLILSWTPNSLMTIGSAEEGELMMSSSGEDICSGGSNTLDSTSEGLDCSNMSSFDGHTSPNSLNEVLCVQDFDTPLGNVFSINLIDAKTIKIFYSSKEKDVGQFVVCSKENEYKVFHFHNVGLTKLTEIFDLWNGCARCEDLNAEEDGQQVYYISSGCTGDVSAAGGGPAAHPEEGRYKPMNMNRWLSGFNNIGQVEDGFNFRKHVFLGGLSQEVRPDAWKYLLYHYPMHSTRREREVIKEQKKRLYESIQERRLALTGDEYEDFWRRIQFTVDKDVVRTDRSHPYYAGQQNPNLDKMRNVLLNYAHHNPDIGYTQGMSDLLAPLLVTLHDESDSFWCFVGLMESSMFATTPTDQSMDKSLGFLRELLRLMAPAFYIHCLCNDEDLNFLFAHRWLVLCFKREFIFHEVLRIWETCWARYQTDYFHIFICVAIVSLYGNVCVEKKMDSVEILQYFTDMAMKFDGSAILTEARSLLYRFRQLNRLPCTLQDLLSGKGVWDGGISPELECVGRHRKCCQDIAGNTNGTQQPTLLAASSPPIDTSLDISLPEVNSPDQGAQVSSGDDGDDVEKRLVEKSENNSVGDLKHGKEVCDVVIENLETDEGQINVPPSCESELAVAGTSEGENDCAIQELSSTLEGPTIIQSIDRT